MELHKDLKALAVSAENNNGMYQYDAVNKELLESFPNPFVLDNKCRSTGTVKISTSEFSSLCPLTHQADWATITVTYEPDLRCVESKSFKLYLASYRNQGEFHESIVNRICNDLVELLEPCWIIVTGEFTPRGGISFHPTAEYSK